MRTSVGRLASFNATCDKICKKTEAKANVIEDGGKYNSFGLSMIVLGYLSDFIYGSMTNTQLADKELDYIIKNL